MKDETGGEGTEWLKEQRRRGWRDGEKKQRNTQSDERREGVREEEGKSLTEVKKKRRSEGRSHFLFRGILNLKMTFIFISKNKNDYRAAHLSILTGKNENETSLYLEKRNRQEKKKKHNPGVCRKTQRWLVTDCDSVV